MLNILNEYYFPFITINQAGEKEHMFAFIHILQGCCYY